MDTQTENFILKKIEENDKFQKMVIEKFEENNKFQKMLIRMVEDNDEFKEIIIGKIELYEKKNKLEHSELNYEICKLKVEVQV